MRFLKFTDEWSKFAVSELLNTYSTNSLSWDKLSYVEKSKIKNIHYGLIHNGFKSTIINGNNQFIPFINNSFIPKSYTLLQNGDLILADASEDRKDVGRPVEMINVDNQKIISGLHTIHARNKTNLIIDGFKGFYFQSCAMKKQIYKVANGSKIYGISPSSFNELFISIPSKEEQQKIVNLLQKIECRIEIQIKIIEDLVLQKKYIISSLLTPFQDKKKILLKDILFDYNVKTTSNNEYPVLSSTASGIYLQSEYFNNKEASSDNTAGYKIIPRGYCTYRSMSDTGLFTFNIQNLVERGIVSPAYPVFSSNEYINEFIILYLNNSTDIKKQILELKSGGTRFALSFSTLCTLKIPKLEKEKQLSLVKTVTAFERKIENEEIILNKLHQQKKYLLNNMFI
mgnify:CR=1 FL=1